MPKFILLVKISWLIFSAVSGVEIKTMQRSEQAQFLVLLLNFMFKPLPHALVLQHEPAHRLALLKRWQHLKMLGQWMHL